MEKEEPKQRRGAITSVEIARLCGVSRTTVSAVLNGKTTVRESTRRKVLECIRQQNYQFGMIARTLVDELSQMVAVLAASLGSPYHMMFFRGVSEVLDAEGYHMLFHNVRPEDQEDPETLASLHAYRPAGYIVLKGAEGLNAEHARKIVELGIPLVSEGRFEGIESHSVNFDSRAGMRMGTDYAIAKGHRRLGHLAGPAFSHGARERKLGFIESLVAHDIPVSDAVIMDAGETATAGYTVALEMLRDPSRRPTAVVCFNDMVAMGVYRAAHELSLDIPGDISVVGFDGIDFAGLFGPPLTSVDIFPTVLGRKAAELALRAIRNQTGRGMVEEWVTPKLVERDSVREI
ncbi:MAG: LacI family DNA-binding transcriptional regulator [Candidatus Hydrogenedentes bacterium]|nr:LacI family DNA-binding transcriptional regulator [Candidatus Hydrogenedentota bacterium]